MYAKNLPSKKVFEINIQVKVPLSLPNPNYSPTLKFSDSEIDHELPNLDFCGGMDIYYFFSKSKSPGLVFPEIQFDFSSSLQICFNLLNIV